MNKDIFSINGENLYKYIVIIGLSLLLFAPLLNNNRIDNMLSQIEIEKEIQQKKQIIVEQQDILEKINIEIQSINEYFTISPWEAITDLNLFNLDGSKIETLDQFHFITNYLIKILSELNNYSDYIIDKVTFEKNIIDLNIITGDFVEYKNISEIIIKMEKVFEKIFSSYAEANSVFSEINDKLDRSNEVLSIIKNRHIEIAFEIEKYHLLKKLYDRENIYNNILKTVGIIMLVSGIILWYIRIQKYIDSEYKKSKKNSKNNQKK